LWPRGRGAFTLLELVLVVTVLVVAAAASWPVLHGWIQSHRLRQGVDNVRTLCARGRAQALKEGRPYRFAWTVGANRYRVAPDGLPNVMAEETLPDGVQFLAGSGNGSSASVLFWPDGTAKILAADGTERPEVEIVLADRQGQARALRLRALTGTTTVVNVRSR
jgi:type II secretory pathway pseudopilin PulG